MEEQREQRSRGEEELRGQGDIEIIQIRDGETQRVRDVVATEVPLTIFLNDKEVATLLTCDVEFKPLAVGFLFAEGFLQNREEISGLFESTARKIVRVYTKDGREPEVEGGMITSGCGRGRSYATHNLETLSDLDRSSLDEEINSLHVSSETILDLMHTLQVQSSLFRKAGGLHTCALAESDRIVRFEKDIGRHNALDRILGTCLLEGIPLEDKIILTSGRASSEMVFKAGRGRVPILVSRSAPTDLAIQIAQQSGITLVGYARGRRMNIYAHPGRIDRRQETGDRRQETGDGRRNIGAFILTTMQFDDHLIIYPGEDVYFQTRRNHAQ